jgi:hypothetical protein
MRLKTLQEQNKHLDISKTNSSYGNYAIQFRIKCEKFNFATLSTKFFFGLKELNVYLNELKKLDFNNNCYQAKDILQTDINFNKIRYGH